MRNSLWVLVIGLALAGAALMWLLYEPGTETEPARRRSLSVGQLEATSHSSIAGAMPVNERSQPVALLDATHGHHAGEPSASSRDARKDIHVTPAIEVCIQHHSGTWPERLGAEVFLRVHWPSEDASDAASWTLSERYDGPAYHLADGSRPQGCWTFDSVKVPGRDVPSGLQFLISNPRVLGMAPGLAEDDPRQLCMALVPLPQDKLCITVRAPWFGSLEGTVESQLGAASGRVTATWSTHRHGDPVVVGGAAFHGTVSTELREGWFVFRDCVASWITSLTFHSAVDGHVVLKTVYPKGLWVEPGGRAWWDEYFPSSAAGAIRLVDALTGASIAAATVTVMGAEYASDSRGVVSFAQPEGNARTMADIRHPEYVSRWGVPVDPSASPTRPHEIALVSGVACRGVVVDKHGLPVADAEVWMEAEPETLSVRTDDSGRFELERAYSGQLAVVYVEVEDALSQKSSVFAYSVPLEEASFPRTLRLQRPVELGVTVSHEGGSPCMAASVSARRLGGVFVEADLWTDESGVYALDDESIPGGEYVIVALCDDHPVSGPVPDARHSGEGDMLGGAREHESEDGTSDWEEYEEAFGFAHVAVPDTGSVSASVQLNVVGGESLVAVVLQPIDAVAQSVIDRPLEWSIRAGHVPGVNEQVMVAGDTVRVLRGPLEILVSDSDQYYAWTHLVVDASGLADGDPLRVPILPR